MVERDAINRDGECARLTFLSQLPCLFAFSADTKALNEQQGRDKNEILPRLNNLFSETSIIRWGKHLSSVR
jgi:hypothetical protein